MTRQGPLAARPSRYRWRVVARGLTVPTDRLRDLRELARQASRQARADLQATMWAPSKH